MLNVILLRLLSGERVPGDGAPGERVGLASVSLATARVATTFRIARLSKLRGWGVGGGVLEGDYWRHGALCIWL
jgi:hypothetical protein